MLELIGLNLKKSMISVFFKRSYHTGIKSFLLIFSEPKSILAPEAAPIPAEELEKMIRERIAEQDKAAGVDASKTQQQHRWVSERS